jgi:pyruvate/2-oxoacid:ferredoxin oxidoreductase beta subunit
VFSVSKQLTGTLHRNLHGVEYGLGMFVAMKHRREKLIGLVQSYVHEMDLKESNGKSEDEKGLVSLLLDWLEVREEKSDKCTLLFDRMKPLFHKLVPAREDLGKRSFISQIWTERDMFPKLSQWIVGGDGWAFDIGFGELADVISHCAFFRRASTSLTTMHVPLSRWS